MYAWHGALAEIPIKMVGNKPAVTRQKGKAEGSDTADGKTTLSFY
jgi:hypothetical protein